MKQNKKRIFLFNQKYKKGISPLITVILLVVIAVVLISLILSFGKNFINDSISETKNLTIFSESEAGMYTTIEME
jgi:flagellin-like protein